MAVMKSSDCWVIKTWEWILAVWLGLVSISKPQNGTNIVTISRVALKMWPRSGWYFPRAVVTSRRRLGGLKQTLFPLTVLEVTSQKSVALGSNQGVSRAILAQEALGEGSLPASFKFWCCQHSLATSLSSLPGTSVLTLPGISLHLCWWGHLRCRWGLPR